jgi:hypothetical protein
MKKIIILDFETAKVHIYDYNTSLDSEDFIESLLYNSNNCQWMIVDELKLEIH